ncbi:CerR family C-terminal domain-containing protein [Solidesulfovibrio sp.]|uniref:CerR family C-terminal domain-containing protein n=1 Tax=Solidesulfovibrio sp. TaxID=2910990 RepID=UPI002B1ED985|nr:CerR family C-terminal domain-containing protein [Solidesulfovibrio sp.]MEA4854975.1 CerR family C-terminal domain-containing protein [Solidesulfovibrio sp.]
MTGNGREDETRVRLLDAAGEIFSCKGYQAATVREITKVAKANLAAIHYHFGSKDRLYQAVLEHAHREACRRFPPDMGLPPGADAKARLYAYVRALLLRLRDKSRHAWLNRLMAREMAEPSPNLSLVVERCLAPSSAVLRDIVAELLGPGAEPVAVARHAQSVVGQCRHFVLDGPVLERLYPDCDPRQGGVEEIARHIVRFSLAAFGCPGARDFVPPILEPVCGDAL